MIKAPTALTALLLAAGLFSAAPATSSRRAATPPAPPSEMRRAQYLAAFEQHVLNSYTQARLTSYGVPVLVYREALLGYYNLAQHRVGGVSRPVLTIIDYARASSQKRLWVLDMEREKVLFHTLVAHGKNTGNDQARAFSNREGSEMSSLGFYLTGQTYQGKHGLSLKLHGQDASYNSNAFGRAIVVHGADYVSEEFVRQHGRLGRSQGCPALPVGLSAAVIQAIRNGTVVYAHGPSSAAYNSAWLQLDPALLAFASQQGLTEG